MRQAYPREPYRRLAWVVGPAERASLLSRIEALERSDLARCSADRYAEPAALFTADPKLALTGSVLGAQLDESSGQGRANKAVDSMKPP